MPIRYEFDPTSQHDGITVEVPLARLDRVDPGVFEWQVPGFRTELVETLIRSLPKAIRKEFIPIGDTVAEVIDMLEPNPEGLLTSLRRELTKRSGVPIGPEDFDSSRLPPHLKPVFRIIDPTGETVAEGEDLGELKSALQDEARSVVTSTAHPIEVTGLTDWTIGELARRVEVAGAGPTVFAYPALVDDGETASVRLMATRAEQSEAMWAGTRRLILLRLPSPGKLVRPLVTDRAKAALAVGPYESTSDWATDCMTASVDLIVDRAGGPAWDGVGFDRLVRETKDRLHPTLTDIAARSLDALEALWAAGVAAQDLPDNPTFEPAIADVTAQLSEIVFPGFITAAGAAKLDDLARYLRAVEHRLDKLPSGPVRDARLTAQIQELDAQHRRLVEALGPTPELVDITWMLQELRVSLFAQHIGTKGKISPERIRKALGQALL
jgi:ATP-dependent helicase HrpA